MRLVPILSRASPSCYRLCVLSEAPLRSTGGGAGAGGTQRRVVMIHLLPEPTADGATKLIQSVEPAMAPTGSYLRLE
ncbi:unnamed protein product [Merluccius merluccius]